MDVQEIKNLDLLLSSSVYSDGCTYGLDLQREGQAHQKY